MNTITSMENSLLAAKAEFDRVITRNPVMSRDAKQKAYFRFLVTIQPTMDALKAAYEERRRQELAADMDALMQMKRRKRKGAA